MPIVGFRHIGIIVSDLKKSLDFYQGILKLKLIQHAKDNSEYISEITGLNGLVAEYAKLLIPGGNVLELLTYPSHPLLRVARDIHQPGEAHLAFEVDSAEEMYNLIVSKNIPYISAPVLSSEKIAKVFFCFDPDGYRIEIVEMLTHSYAWNPVIHEKK
jgi:catechol 2,3-dioxygenase-like lactoylglutathione lyase family enzyme